MLDGVGPGGVSLSTGVLPWTPFDTTNPASAIFYSTWNSLGIGYNGAGTTPMQSFFSILGTLSDSNNLLVLDS